MKHVAMIILSTMCSLLVCSIPYAEKSKISIKQILEIANAEAESVGINVASQQIEIFYNVTPTKMLFPKIKRPDYLITEPEKILKEKLQGREFWAVYYSYPYDPDVFSYGGDTTIYIDANTGEIIEIYRTA